jgi:hypothetical protein
MRTLASLATLVGLAAATASGPIACSASTSAPGSIDGGPVADASDAAADGGVPDGGPDDGSDTCDHAATTTYGCSPMPAGEGACQGGPPQAGDAGSDVSYPLGCVATLPSCNPFFAGEATTCSCTPLGMTAMWVCAL